MKNYKVIVCEREPMLRTMLVEFLCDQGYMAYGVNTIDQCVDMFAYVTPDLVLLDSDIGDELEIVSQKIRAKHKTIPIILMNGLNGTLAREQALQDGATTSLDKPFKFHDMIAKIVEAMFPQKAKGYN